VRAIVAGPLTLHAPEGTDPDALTHAALGPGLAACWTLRGNPVLHGSCVAFGDRAACFLGPQGQGKSTLAAQLVAAGNAFVSDGLTLVSEQTDRVFAHPGPPWFKLDDRSLRGLDLEPQSFQPVHRGTGKRLRPQSVVPEPLPLTAVYVLADGAEFDVQRLSGAAALAAVLENMYLAAFLEPGPVPILFQQAARVARSVPVFRLQRRRAWEAVEGTIARIEQHVESQAPVALASP
jgi:hypothetical protein